MWYAILLSFGLVLLLFFTTNPTDATGKLNEFALATGGSANFFETAKAAAADAGVTVHPPFWLFGTLMVAPIAWTSLQWATYSVEQGGEIKNAHVFRNQLFIIVGSLIATAGLLVLLAVGMKQGIGNDGILVASSGYWYAVPEATIAGTFLMPNMIAIALTSSPILIAIIGVGYILNSFQIVCNCYIGTTRIMVAQGLDGLLPDWFARVHPRLKTPLNAHIAYFLAAVPVIIAYNKYSEWVRWTLGVTFANGAVMTLSALARLAPRPGRQAVSGIAGRPVPVRQPSHGHGLRCARVPVRGVHGRIVPVRGRPRSRVLERCVPVLHRRRHGGVRDHHLLDHAHVQGSARPQGRVRLLGDPTRIGTALDPVGWGSSPSHPSSEGK